MRLTPVNALQKHRQLGRRQGHGSAGGLRPYKAAALQPLLKQAESVAIGPKQSYEITALATEDEDMAGIGLPLQDGLDQGAESLKAAPEIGEPGGNPNPRACLQLNQRVKLPRTARTSAGSAPLSTLTRARPGSSMWVEPVDTATRVASGSTTLSGSAATVTGKSQARG